MYLLRMFRRLSKMSFPTSKNTSCFVVGTYWVRLELCGCILHCSDRHFDIVIYSVGFVDALVPVSLVAVHHADLLLDKLCQYVTSCPG